MVLEIGTIKELEKSSISGFNLSIFPNFDQFWPDWFRVWFLLNQPDRFGF